MYYSNKNNKNKIYNKIITKSIKNYNNLKKLYNNLKKQIIINNIKKYYN